MTFIKVETPGLEKAVIQAGPGWQVTHHRLFAVSPDEADKVSVKGGKVTVWDLCFLEDLFQATNQSKGLLLDVGWYPHADPTGSFRLVVARQLSSEQGNRSPYDWSNPVVDLRTRSLEEILHRIQEILTS